MKYYIIICAHNEEEFIEETLQSVVDQSVLPQKVVIVNDHSTDNTESIIDKHTLEHDYLIKINNNSSELHMPGSKVVQAFYRGLSELDEEYDFLVKLDADIILPKNYFEIISRSARWPRCSSRILPVRLRFSAR